MIEARDLVMDYTAGMARVQADHSVTGVMPLGAGTGGPHPYAAGETGYAMPASRRCCTRSPASSARRRAR